MDVTLNGKRYSMTKADVERVVDEAPDSPRRRAELSRQPGEPSRLVPATSATVSGKRAAVAGPMRSTSS